MAYTFTTTTVSSLPSASANSGKVYTITDGSSETDRTVGHGGYTVVVRSNGLEWLPIVFNGDASFRTHAHTIDEIAGFGIGSTVQAWDADLDAIAALSGTSGFLKKTAANTWGLDTGTTVVADTGTSNNFLTAISALGVISKAQPAFSNLSGSVAASQMPALTGDVTTSAGAVATTIGSGKVTNSMLAGSIDLTAKVTGVLPTANGGTGVAYFSVAGPTTTRTYTFPNANATIARTDAANTFIGHQTIEGITSTGATGTGKFVFDGSPTITTPTILTSIKDTNGNIILSINAVASAVNYFQISNSTGSVLDISAIGADSAIGTSITNKGSGARTLIIGTQDAVTLSALAARNTGTSLSTGAGLLFQFGTGTNIGGIAAVTTDVTGGAEKADLFFRAVNAGTLTEWARIKSYGTFEFSGPARVPTYTVSALPSGATTGTGSVARVSDGGAALAWGATVTGGGSTVYLVWYNGTNWTVAGK